MIPPATRADERDGVLTGPDGRRVGWLARGPEDGTPAIYVHGWPGSRLEQRLIPSEVLGRFHVRLISIDRPGYGNTDPRRGERSDRVRDVLSVADALGIDRFPVMGISCGGSNVVTLAAIAPDRVTKVVTVSGQMPYDDEEAITALAPDQLAELPLCRLGRTPELEASCIPERQRWLDDPVGWLDDVPTFSDAERRWAAQPWVREVFAAEVREGVRPGVEGLIEDAVLCVKPFDVDVSTIRCPVVSVHGTADDWEPLPNLRRILELLPTTELLMLDGMNHFGPLLYPDLLISLVSDRRR